MRASSLRCCALLLSAVALNLLPSSAGEAGFAGGQPTKGTTYSCAATNAGGSCIVVRHGGYTAPSEGKLPIAARAVMTAYKRPGAAAQ